MGAELRSVSRTACRGMRVERLRLSRAVRMRSRCIFGCGLDDPGHHDSSPHTALARGACTHRGRSIGACCRYLRACAGRAPAARSNSTRSWSASLRRLLESVEPPPPPIVERAESATRPGEEAARAGQTATVGPSRQQSRGGDRKRPRCRGGSAECRTGAILIRHNRGAPAAAAKPPAPVVAPRFDAAYLNNPRPEYPRLARRLGEHGRVLLHVFVNPAGRPEKIEVRTSSGYARLDQAAREAVQQWHFVPARQGDEAVGAWVLVPITFVLEG